VLDDDGSEESKAIKRRL
jgi:hypothetical protein